IGGALIRPRGGRFVLLLCMISAVLALGGHTPLLKFLYQHGIATSIRYPEKFALAGMFTLIVFASQMADRLLGGDDDLRDAALGFAIAVTIVAAVIAGIAFTPLYRRTFMHIWSLTAGAGANRMIAISRQDW